MTNIALICSLGGHLTGMRILEDIYKNYDHFFITYKGVYDLNIKTGKIYNLNNINSFNYDKRSVISFIKLIIINSFIIGVILIREKPKILISTGDSSLTIPAFYFGKLIGAKTIFIENIGRINPSVSGRIVYPILDKLYVRSNELLKKYGSKAEFYDYYKKDVARNIVSQINKDIIFITSGSSNYQFNRLIKKMDDIALKLNLPVVMQIGNSNYNPKNAKFFSFCELYELKKYYTRANIVVGHAGGGTFLDMVKFGVKGIMLPRKKEYGEAIHNHQLEQAKFFNELGIMFAKNEQDLEDLLLNHQDDIIPIKLNLEKGNQRLVYVIRKYIDSILKNGEKRTRKTRSMS